MAYGPTISLPARSGRLRLPWLPILLLLCGATLSPCAFGDPNYDVVLLSPPNNKSGNLYSQVSANGTVVGVHGPWQGGAPDANGMLPYQPALYANGNLTPLVQTLGGASTVAYSINAVGHVAGCSDDGKGAWHAFLYASGRMQDLGTLKHARSCASFVNDNDDVVGNLSDDAAGSKLPETRAFLYRKGVMRDLNDIIAPDPKLFKGQKYVLTNGNAINDHGDMLLQAKTADGQSAILIYSGGKLTLPDPEFQAAHRVRPATFGHLTANREFVATEWSQDFSASHTYLYRAGHFEALNAMTADANAESYDINTAGNAVGASSLPGKGARLSKAFAFLFKDGKMLDLNSTVDPEKLLLNGKQYVLKVATGINDAGVIVGDASPAGEAALGAVFVLTPRAPGEHLSAAAMGKALQDQGAVEIYDILFDSGKTAMKTESRPTLEQIAKLLGSDAALKLEVSGHTDNQGNAKRNLALSKSRAEAVVQALVRQYGIDAKRLQAAGYGDSRPVAPNDSDSGRAKNRRVELRKVN